MNPVRTTTIQTRAGAWVRFAADEQPVFISKTCWIGFDLDGTLARTDNPGHFEPPYPIGEPIPHMVDMAKRLIAAGVTVKIFTARACDVEKVPKVIEWLEKQGLGRLPVTNQKDFDLIRFFDDRAVPFVMDHRRNLQTLPNVKCDCGKDLLSAPFETIVDALRYDDCLRRYDDCGIGYSNMPATPARLFRQG